MPPRHSSIDASQVVTAAGPQDMARPQSLASKLTDYFDVSFSFAKISSMLKLAAFWRCG